MSYGAWVEELYVSDDVAGVKMALCPPLGREVRVQQLLEGGANC